MVCIVVGILKWRFNTKDEDALPISVNVWPNLSGKECNVNIEYESSTDAELQNVEIAIPGIGAAPQIN